MGVKDLFNKPMSKALSIQSEETLFNLEDTAVESQRHATAKIENKNRYIPPVDFATASNFARFGSAEEYYKSSFRRIYQQYPYDGAIAEQQEFLNDSTYLDLHIFDKVYPRSNGYAIFSPAGWGTISSPGSALSGGYGLPSTTEYIVVKGGPHTSSNDTAGQGLSKAFGDVKYRTTPGANIYDTDIYGTAGEQTAGRTGTRESSLRFDLSKGISTEFWLNEGSAGCDAETAATAVDCIDLTGVEAAEADCSFTILIPTSAGGLGGTAITFLLDDSATTDSAEGANTIAIGTAGISDAAKAAKLILAINAATDGLIDYASSGNGQAGYDIGVTAAEGSSDTQITLTMDTTGFTGNVESAITTASGVDIVDVRNFTGGLGICHTKQVIFDLWNGAASSSAGYGRLLIGYSGSLDGENPLYAHLASGSNVWDMTFGGSTTTTSSLKDTWNHIGLTFFSSSTDKDLQAKFYLNGNLQETTASSHLDNFGQVTGSLIGYIGSLQTSPSGNSFDGYSMAGYGKISGSIDEFRYWKTKRTSKDVGRHWFTQVGGGVNDDISNADLGVYYKFNEGVVGKSATDSVAIDYSGRVSNGNWVGYASGARGTGSAMVLANAAATEFKDPILYLEHPSVETKYNELIKSGSTWDSQNGSMLYHSFPSFVLEEDEQYGKELLTLTQIMASHFDDLNLLADALPNIQDMTYVSSSSKPLPFAESLLASRGFQTPEIFEGVDLLGFIANRDEGREFESEIGDIKNQIYQNINNNLSYIYKSKGTEKSFRNLIRCYGVDEELIKLNLYGNNLTHTLSDNTRSSATKKRYVDFNTTTNHTASVFQQTASSNENTTDGTFISGSNQYIPATSEIEVIFPKKVPKENEAFALTPFISSSIFGTHTPSTAYDHTWLASANDYGFQLYAIRAEHDSPDAYFLIKDRKGGFSLTSSIYKDVYENQKWNFAVRFKNENYPLADFTTGSTSDNITLEVYGVNAFQDIIQNEFTASKTGLSKNYVTSNLRYYIGADRTNFSGAVQTKSDVKASSLRHWTTYLNNDTIRAHAKDPDNYGTPNPARSAYLFESNANIAKVPQSDTLALHWNFANVTGSDSSGEISIEDFSSGSVSLRNRYPGTVGPIVGNQYSGRGIGFLESNTSSIDLEYLTSARQQLPESLGGNDMVVVRTSDDNAFGWSSRPINYYYTFEKSMNQVISEEIINMFGTIVEFNNLIGAPVNKYRQEYKDLEKLRNLFFERMGNTPDVNKFISYYKWIDASLSLMLQQLIPATADMSEGVLNIIESHALERNKYLAKFPLLESKESTETAAKGVYERTYSWPRGHAPLMVAATATVTVADGDADSGMTEKESMTIASTDGTTRNYVVIDDNATTVATGAALATTSDTGANQAGTKATATWTFTDKPNETTTITLIDYEGTSLVFEVDNDGDGGAGANIEMDPASNNAAGMSAILISKVNASALKITATTGGGATGEVLLTQDNAGTAGNKSIALNNYANWNANTTATFPTAFSSGAEVAANSVAVAINTTGTAATQNDFLVQLKAAIEGSTGHAGKILVSAVPTEANGAQAITLTQALEGISGNGATISDDISQTTIVGFAGGYDKENENALWWKERAERGGPTITSGDDTVDNYRGVINERIVSETSGSAIRYTKSGEDLTGYHAPSYETRNLSKVYKISSDLQSSIYGGNTNLEDNKKHYYKDSISFGTSDKLEITDLQSSKDIIDQTDPFIPKALEKEKKSFTVGPDLDRDYAPFTIYSSSVETGYQSDISSKFSAGVDITNLHEDSLSITNEIPMQGPFTEKFVGGSPHRHADLNFSGSGTSKTGKNALDSAADRVEPYDMTLATGKITINHRDVNQPRSDYYRTETAKRPVNIKNIKQVTGSSPAATEIVSGTLQASIGNYNKTYEVVQTSDRSTNNKSFVENEGFGTSSLTSTSFSNVEYASPVRRRTEHVIVERFSAPGGPETAGDSSGGPFLDLESGQYSPYNDINSRNSTVRTVLNTLLTEKTEQFGIRSGSTARSEDYEANASFHKVNKNSLNRRENINHIAAVVATATITVADGDAASGMTEKETIVITSTDGTEKTYCVIDDNATTVATGAVLAADSDIGSQVAGAALVGAIAVAINLTGSASTQNTFLVQLKAAIEHANGHNGKITVSAVPGQANGAQLITLTQAVAGASGNVAITDGISQTTLAGFSNGVDTYIANEVVSTHDNYYVQHPIPRSDTQYAWITSSYASSHVLGHAAKDGMHSGSSEGVTPAIIFTSASSESTSGINVDHVGLNTLIYEPVSSSDARIGYPLGNEVTLFKNTELATVSTPDTLNATLLHRGGIYGHPSWKQIRNESNPIVREWKSSNTIAINKSPGETIVSDTGERVEFRSRFEGLRTFTEPPVTTRNHPLTFVLGTNIGGEVKTTIIKSAFGNEVENFSNTSLNNYLNLPTNDAGSYDKIKNLYLGGALDSSDSPIESFVELSYKQGVYPKAQNSHLIRTRQRNSYANNFWRAAKASRDTKGDTKHDGSYSSWDMDSDTDFITAITGTTAGILQNNKTHCRDLALGTDVALSYHTASVLFHLKHTIHATASVTAFTAAPNTQTGSCAPSQTNPFGTVNINGGNAVWQVGEQAGYYDKNGSFVSAPSDPWYDSYDDYAEDLRIHGKDYSVVPEFRISEHIEDYMKKFDGDFLIAKDDIFSIFGAASASTYPQNSSEDDFYNIYTNSDFMKQFEVVQNDHKDFVDASSITLTCEALTKFNPYDGFYPAELIAELYTQFSKSYGDHVAYSGSAALMLGDSMESVKIRPFITPMFAPGIWCNTIKSGLAVDFPVFTGSYAIHAPKNTRVDPDVDAATTYRLISLASHGSKDGWDMRVPFEALVSPEKYLSNTNLTDLFTSHHARLNLTASWSGFGDNLYKMRAHNALASMIDFFLPGDNNKGEMSSIISSPENEFGNFVNGTTYGMRVKLRKSYNKERQQWFRTRYGYASPHDVRSDVTGGLEQTITLCSRPSSFGPPVGGRKNIAMLSGTGDSSHTQNMKDSLTGFNPAFTPPYYDGEAWCDILYEHDVATQPTLKEIQNKSKIVSWRFDPLHLDGSSNAQPYGKNNINYWSMQLTSSINVLGRSSAKSIEYDSSGRPNLVKDDETQTSDFWVIQPKFVTPIVNVHNVSASIQAFGSESVPRSVWSQFGSTPSGSTGIFLEVDDIEKSWIDLRVPKYYNQTAMLADGDSVGARDYSNYYGFYGSGSGVHSLVDNIGIKKSSVKLGQIATSRVVKEAIVAIPFLEKGGRRSFFSIPRSNIDDALGVIAGEESSGTAGDSIIEMIEKMQNYILPPKLDFIKNPDSVDPYAMYIFEFEHKFDRNDLSYIWQNIQPRSSRVVKKSASSVSHKLLTNELMGETAKNTNKTLQPELRWMVFKIKQKAETNYYDKVVNNASSDPRFRFEQKFGSMKLRDPGIPEYSYNWPYDNFSLVESIKISSEVKFSVQTEEETNIVGTANIISESGINSDSLSSGLEESGRSKVATKTQTKSTKKSKKTGTSRSTGTGRGSTRGRGRGTAGAGGGRGGGQGNTGGGY